MKILMIVLSIVGAVALLLLVLLAWWLKGLFGGIKHEMAKLVSNSHQGNPFRISLRPLPHAPWQNPDLVETVTLGFQQLGYQPCGDFEIPEMRPTMPNGEPSPDPVLVRALHLRLLGTYAVIYAVPNFGILLDVFGDLTDGRSLTITSNKPSGLDRPDFARTVYLSAAQDQLLGLPREMHQRMLAESQGLEFVRHGADEFTQCFTGQYHRDMDWMIERGGQTVAELRRVAQNAGKPEPDESGIALVQDVWNTRVEEFLYEEVMQKLLKELSADQWEKVRDNLFLVYDPKPIETLRDYLVDSWMTHEDSDDADNREARLRAKLAVMNHGFRGRTAFAQGLEALPMDRRPHKLMEFAQPIPVEVYVHSTVKLAR